MLDLIKLSEINNSGSDQDFDYVFRIKGSDTKPGRYEIVYAETKMVAYPFVNIVSENYNLRFILQNQWRTYKYILEYNNYLLGNYTKENFLSIARQYAQPFLRLTDEQILDLTFIILKTIGETLTSAEISQFLNVDPADIERVLKKYPHNKIAEQFGE